MTEIQSLHRNSVKKTEPMFGKTKKVKGRPEHKAVVSKPIMDNIFEGSKILINTMAEVLPTDWSGCQPADQDESNNSSEAVCNEKEVMESPDNGFFDYVDDDGKEESEWDKEEDFSDAEFSQMSSERKELRGSLKNSDSVKTHHFSCITEPKVMASEGDYCVRYEDTVLSCPQEKEVMAADDHSEDEHEDELEWTEEDSDWSEEGDSEIPAESMELWSSFVNSDPYNPLYFCPTETKTKSLEIQQNHTPSNYSAGEEDHEPVPSTKKGAKMVCFSKEVTIHLLEEWPSESRAARDGSCWMEMAIDRHRFQRRVELTGNIISPCLQTQHRAKVVERLFSYSDLSCFNNNKSEQIP